MNRADKSPTCVSLVERVLKDTDDFVSAEILMAVTGCSSNQVSAALHHLQKCGAAEAVESSSRLWWFSTPTTDKRVRHVDERRKEDKPRRTRRTKAQ